ncbi:hypothetical protein C8R46DRAFT_1042459 [Mycena filopes]|nr:hypothetical protein C8R46DRAFT_1239352 [Mycena filopes]KAJ7152819.1 hypothetical protein C8R46DRAFT_1042459 [Mycena filopes]
MSSSPPPRPPPKFPSCFPLQALNPLFGDTHKTKLRPLIIHYLRQEVRKATYPVTEGLVLPRNFQGHALGGVRCNLGTRSPGRLGQIYQICDPKMHRNCNRIYHALTPPQPELRENNRLIGLLLGAWAETAPTPRDSDQVTPPRRGPSGSSGSSSMGSSSSRRAPHDVGASRPARMSTGRHAPYPGARPNSRFGPPLSPLPAMQIHGPNSPFGLPLSPLPAMQIHGLPDEAPPSPTPAQVFEHYSPTGHIVPAPRSPSTISVISANGLFEDSAASNAATRATSIISISSDSDDESEVEPEGSQDLLLAYPDFSREPVIMDLLTPVRVFVLLDTTKHRRRRAIPLTVYPRHRAKGTAYLVLTDFQHVLARAGFDTNRVSEIYLQFADMWLEHQCYYPYPIVGRNTVLFLRTRGIPTATPDEVLDAYFK